MHKRAGAPGPIYPAAHPPTQARVRQGEARPAAHLLPPLQRRCQLGARLGIPVRLLAQRCS